MKKIHLIAGFAAALALVQSPAPAQSFGEMPASANWYVHVNVRLLEQTAVTAPFYAESLGEAFADIHADLGIDLADEVDAITAFGSDLPMESAALLLHGELSQATHARLDELLANASHFVEHDHAGATFLAVSGLDSDGPDHDQTDDDLVLVHFAPGKTLVTTDRSLMTRYLDGGGQLVPLTDFRSDTLIVLKADRTLVQGGFNAQQLDLKKHWNSSILSNIEQAAGIISEQQGGLHFKLQVLANSAETAASVSNVLQGLLALKALSGGDEPWLDQLISQVVVTVDHMRVSASVFVAPELAAQFVDEM